MSQFELQIHECLRVFVGEKSDTETNLMYRNTTLDTHAPAAASALFEEISLKVCRKMTLIV